MEQKFNNQRQETLATIYLVLRLIVTLGDWAEIKDSCDTEWLMQNPYSGQLKNENRNYI